MSLMKLKLINSWKVHTTSYYGSQMKSLAPNNPTALSWQRENGKCRESCSQGPKRWAFQSILNES